MIKGQQRRSGRIPATARPVVLTRRLTPPEERSSARRGRRGSIIPRGQRRHVHPHPIPRARRPAAIIAVAPERRSASSCRAPTPNTPSPSAGRALPRPATSTMQGLSSGPPARNCSQTSRPRGRSWSTWTAPWSARAGPSGRWPSPSATTSSGSWTPSIGVRRPDRHRCRPPGCRHREVQRPADRPLRLGEDPPGQGPGRVPGRPLRHRRRHHADRGRLCRRGRGERPPQAPPRRQHGRAGRPAGDRLHRRDRQARRGPCPRHEGHAAGRPARPAEDDRGDGRQRAPERRLQEPDGARHPVRHDQRAVHLRRGLRRPGGDHRPAAGPGGVRVRPAGRSRRKSRRACSATSCRKTWSGSA